MKQSDLIKSLPESVRKRNEGVLGKVGSDVAVKSKPIGKAVKIHEQLEWMKLILRNSGIEFEEEHRFSKRKFRFDIAILDKMVAYEYEGIKSRKSRHTTLTGYTNDATKYNLAQSLGWKVYRYTVLNYRDFEQDIFNHLTI